MVNSITIAALALCAGAFAITSLQAAPITEGQWLQLNFTDDTNPADKDNFNYFIDQSNGLKTNETTGTSTTLIDSEGNTVDGSVTVSGWQGKATVDNSSWSGMSSNTPAAGTSTWSGEEIDNFWWDATGIASITIGGLDPSLNYNVYYYSKHSSGGAERHTLDINGTTQTTAGRSGRFADGDEDLLFENIFLNGDGELVLTWGQFESEYYNPFVNAIVIEAVEAVAAPTITEGQWLQLNFAKVDNPAGKDNFNYFIDWSNGLKTNETTGTTTRMIDSLGNSVDATLTASGWQGSGSTDNSSWSGMSSNTPAAGTSTWSGDEINNFWWDSGAADTSITIGGLNPDLVYNVYFYSKLNAPTNVRKYTLDINGTTQTAAPRNARFLDGDEDLLFENISLNGSGELVLTWGADGSYNPFVNAIVIEAVAAPTITEGQWLQLNFTEGSNPAAKDNFNYFIDSSDGLKVNETIGSSTVLIDSLGSSVNGSVTVSGWGGGGTLNNSGWSGMSSNTPAAGTSTWSTDEINNFWYANGTTPVLTFDGLDASLSYNVYIYSKADAGNGGEVTTVDINGTSQDMASRADRFLDSDEDLLMQDVILDENGKLVITLLNGPGSAQYNPILTSIIIEAVDFPTQPFDVIPDNLLVNGDFTQVTNQVGDATNSWGVTGSHSTWPGSDDDRADVVGWSFYYNDPSNLVADVDTLLDGTDKMACFVTTSGLIGMNSASSYQPGLKQENILSDVTINPSLSYTFSVDVRRNGNDEKDHSSTTFTAALTQGTGAAVTDPANAVTGGSIVVLPGAQDALPNLGDEAGSAQVTTISGADLLAAQGSGQLNVIFDVVNTEVIDGPYPEAAPDPLLNPDNVSQTFVTSVSLTFIPPAGDLNKDGWVTQADVDLANLYLAGDGGDDAATRQAALIADGMTAAEALAYLNLTDFDIDSDNDFDAADVTALEALLVVPDVVIESSGFNGTSFEVQVSGLVNGTTYYLMRDSDLSDGADFTTEADSVTASSDTATLSDDTPPADQAFYQVTD